MNIIDFLIFDEIYTEDLQFYRKIAIQMAKKIEIII